MVASQKAPLYLALTSVPMLRQGGSSELACEGVCVWCTGVRGVSLRGGGVGEWGVCVCV